MPSSFRAMPWRAIARGVVIVYGITFLSALLLAFNGVTPETDRIAYPLLALLTGGIGVAIALRVTGAMQLAHMALLGVGVWLFNFTSVMIGAQSFTAWLESSLFIFTTLILGRLLLGTTLEPDSPADFSPERRLLDTP
ncbi:MAG TPA: hypothetical protein VD738_01485 [Nitrospira sp.]|nr:hypothetical protein [Nitrospira sp.]